MPNYFLNLFSEATFKVFLDAGGSVTGFSATQEADAAKVAVGDIFLAYITTDISSKNPGSSFVAALEVMSKWFRDETDFGWGEKAFPVRFKVRPLKLLREDRRVFIKPLLPQLKAYQKLENKERWSFIVRSSLRRFDKEDALLILGAIQGADQPKPQEVPQTLNTQPSAERNQFGSLSDEAILRRLQKLNALNDQKAVSKGLFKRVEEQLVQEYLSRSDQNS